MSIRIFSDSTCDLGPELIKRYDITIVPLSIIMGDKIFFDGEAVTQTDIFSWCDENKTTPKTAAIDIERLSNAAGSYLENNDDIIFFTISSSMSSTFNIASIYARENGNGHMHVIDSENLSTGIGLLVIKAAEMAAEGISAENIVREIEKLKVKIRSSFVIDTLTFLSRGGRCSSVTSLLANTLHIHPMISVKNGTMGIEKKFHGNLDSSIFKYLNYLEEELKDADPSRIFITHTIPDDSNTVNEVRDILTGLNIFDEILDTKAGGVVSSHCGPGTLGILFMKKT